MYDRSEATAVFAWYTEDVGLRLGVPYTVRLTKTQKGGT